MSSPGAIINLVNTSSDTQLLLSLVSDDLLLNYKTYIKSNVLNSTFDYSSISTKIAYDAFVNSSVTTVSGNIQTDTVRTKNVITYVKQYVLDIQGNKIYSYRITNQDTPVVVPTNATNTVAPGSFVTDVQTIEQTLSLYYIKTTVTQTYLVNIRDDFLTMPPIFADLRSPFSPSSSQTYFALRSMLINYYSNSITTSSSMIATVLVGLSFVLGVGMLLVNFSWKATVIYISTTLLPIVLAFNNPIDTTSISQEIINQNLMFNNYLIISGLTGSLVSLGSILYGIVYRGSKLSS